MRKLNDLKNYSYNIVDANNKDIFNKYLLEVRNYSPLSKEEELELFKKIEKDGDTKAIDKLCLHNLRFVIAVSKKYANSISSSSLTLEDLVSEGNMGLYIAIRKFDYHTGNKFISYAVWWIRQYIMKAIQTNTKSIRLPDHITRLSNRINKKEAYLEQELGRTPTTLEVFEAMYRDLGTQNTLSKFEEIIKVNLNETSLNKTIDFDEKMELSELLKSDDNEPDQDLIYKERHELAIKMLDNLPQQIRNYFNDYFGLCGNSQLNLTEMGQKYGELPATIKVRIDKYMRRIKSRNRKNREFFYPTSNSEEKLYFT